MAPHTSGVSSGLDAVSAQTLLDDTELARDPEAPKTGLQWPSYDPNVVAASSPGNGDQADANGDPTHGP